MTGRYLSSDHRHPVAEVASGNAPLRAARLIDPPEVSFELHDEIGIAVHLNERFALVRRTGSRSVETAGRFGEVFIDAPGNRIAAAVRGECRLAQMSIPLPAVMTALAEDHGLAPDPGWLRAMRVESHPGLTRLLCLGLCEPEAWDEVRTGVVACLADLWRDGAGQCRVRSGLAPARLRRACDFVEANIATATLSGMAAEAALSPFHFSREFRRETGSAPWEYVVTRRLARAIDLLGATDLGIEVIARQSGFSHASHLQRHFRARIGATAGAVRRRLLP